MIQNFGWQIRNYAPQLLQTALGVMGTFCGKRVFVVARAKRHESFARAAEWRIRQLLRWQCLVVCHSHLWRRDITTRRLQTHRAQAPPSNTQMSNDRAKRSRATDEQRTSDTALYRKVETAWDKAAQRATEAARSAIAYHNQRRAAMSACVPLRKHDLAVSRSGN